MGDNCRAMERPRVTGKVWVCVDCYDSHHYGADCEPLVRSSEWDRDEYERNREGRHFTDWTCSDHNGTNYSECEYCGAQDWETGIDEFSKGSCDLCGSHLAGWRFRLAEWGDQ